MKSNLVKTSIMIALVTILSKFAGFFRDVMIAKSYGATLVSDAYFYASQLPALAIILLGGLGGPFHTATVAVFSKIIPNLEEKPSKDVQKLFNSFVTITGVFFAVLAILFWAFAPQIINIIAANGSLELRALAASHLKIMSPILLIGGVIGIFYGIANVYKEFFYTSLSPAILSIVVIVTLLFVPNDAKGYVLVWATLAGAFGQLLFQLPVFFKAGFRYIPTFNFDKEKMKKIGEILFPAILGTTIGQINIYIDMFFTSSLQEGAWTAIAYANRVFQFPVGILITAMLVPLFPMFSRFVGEKDFSSLRKYFHEGLNSLFFLAFYLTMFILLFSQDIVMVLFQRGNFDSAATLMVSEALFFITLSIIPYMARDTITRIFYAFDDSKTPFIVAMCSVAIKILMNAIFVKICGIGGIMLSTTIVTIFNATMLSLLFLRKKVSLEYKGFIVPLIKMMVATAFSAGICLGINHLFMLHYPNVTWLTTFIKLGIMFVTGGIGYFLFAIILRLSVAKLVTERILEKVRK